MSKFTPGPWGIVDGLFISGPDGVEFASTKFDACEERREANARLISAAPDMYEALKAFLKYYVGFVNSGDAGFWDPEKDEIVINARAALSKAEGGGQ